MLLWLLHHDIDNKYEGGETVTAVIHQRVIEAGRGKMAV